jgi:hypothetical protein
MLHSAADIVRFAMIQLGLGTLPADRDSWPIFVAQEPNGPDEVMTLYDTSGQLFGRIQQTGESVQHYGFQVMLRALTSHGGMAKLQEVETALNTQLRRTQVTAPNPTGTGDSVYLIHAVTQRSGILPLGADQENSNRYLFSLNYTAAIGEL